MLRRILCVCFFCVCVGKRRGDAKICLRKWFVVVVLDERIVATLSIKRKLRRIVRMRECGV